MAKEIVLNVTLQAPSQNLRFNPGPLAIDQAVLRKSWATQGIGTTAEAISVSSDMATLGMAVFWNRDTTNFVSVGLVVSSTFYPFVKLKPGERFAVRLVPGVTYFAKADTADVDLDCLILND